MNHFFKTEKARKIFADNKQFNKLKRTYSGKYPELKDINSSKFWDKLNKKTWISSTISPMTLHRIVIVKNLIPKKMLKILNIGFGSALLERKILPNKKYNWHGIDLSKKSVDRASKLFPTGKFSVKNATKLKYKDSFFDCVIALEVLEHIQPSNILMTLNEIHRVLIPNGLLIISVPINEKLEQLIDKNQNPNGHLRDYSENLIRAELEISGFEIIKKISLYAFKNLYILKTLSVKLFSSIKEPNNVIILAQKK